MALRSIIDQIVAIQELTYIIYAYGASFKDIFYEYQNPMTVLHSVVN